MTSIHIGYGGTTEQNDAILMARLATVCNYDNVILLTGEQANAASVLKELLAAADTMKRDDKLFISISALGTHGPDGPCVVLADGTLSIRAIKNHLALAPEGALIEMMLDTAYYQAQGAVTRGRDNLEATSSMISLSKDTPMRGSLIIYHAGTIAGDDVHNGFFTKSFYDNVIKNRRISSMRYFLEKDLPKQGPYVEYVNASKGHKMRRAVFHKLR
jgi:hypothetical protein